MAEGEQASCPECGKVFDPPGAQGKVLLHRVAAHKYRSQQKQHAGGSGASSGSSSATKSGAREPSRKAGAPLPGEAEVEATVRKAVGFMRGGGGILHGMGVRHLGITIMGVECPPDVPGAFEESTDDKGKPRYWVVRSRAIMAQPLLIDQAKRDIRVYQALQAFNRFCEGGTAIEVAGGLVAAGAVDAGLPPGVGFKLGAMPVQPIPMVIGDVLDYVAAEDEEAARQQAQQGAPPPPGPGAPLNGEAPAGGEGVAVVVEGGVEAT